MRLTRKDLLLKMKVKNIGNQNLCKAIDQLISDIEGNQWASKEELKESRPDADQVHSDGFFFFNIKVHRTLVLMEMSDEGEATIVWAGTHDEYERVFKNSKDTIRKYLRDNGWIN